MVEACHRGGIAAAGSSPRRRWLASTTKTVMRLIQGIGDHCSRVVGGGHCRDWAAAAAGGRVGQSLIAFRPALVNNRFVLIGASGFHWHILKHALME
jgi:hypothetical protein